MLANYRPQKNHVGLIKALVELKKIENNFICLLAGNNIDHNNYHLTNLIKNHNLSQEVMLLGRINHFDEFMSNLDIHILSSNFGEAFPNVIAEAMSCEVLCIANDVGDTKDIILDTGIITNTNKPISFAKAINSLILLKKNNFNEWKIKKKKAKELILKNYNIHNMCENYISAWKK
jgi:Glycosyltransferase